MSWLDLLKERGWFFFNRNMADFSAAPLKSLWTMASTCLHRWSLLSIQIMSLHALDHPWVRGPTCLTMCKQLEECPDTLVAVQWVFPLPHSHFKEWMSTVRRLSDDRRSQVGTDDLKDGKAAISNTPNPHPCIISNTVFSLMPTVLHALWTSTLLM